jgi:hypothetical protein
MGVVIKYVYILFTLFIVYIQYYQIYTKLVNIIDKNNNIYILIQLCIDANVYIISISININIMIVFNIIIKEILNKKIKIRLEYI